MSNDKVFANLSELVATDDNIDDQISQIESLCMNCGQNGTTRLLMTEIPFFRQVVIMSFECPHCHYTNNELQPAQQIAERGVRFAVNCDSAKVCHVLRRPFNGKPVIHSSGPHAQSSQD